MHTSEQCQVYNMNENDIEYENGIDFEMDLGDYGWDQSSLNGYAPFIDDSDWTLSEADLPSVTLAVDPPPNIFSINNENFEPMVTLHWDGSLEYGPSYTPDESAKTFWTAMCGYAPKNHFNEIADLEKLVATACEHGQYNFDEYQYGMANGLILALAVMKGEEPQYLDRPEQWLWSIADEKTPPSSAASQYGTQPERCSDDEAFYDLPEVQEAISEQAGEIAKLIDDAIVEELIEEAEKMAGEDYERAMKGL